MTKISSPDLEAGYRSVEKLTEFITDVSQAIDNTLSRDGSSPNQMEASLDMNSQHIINLPAPVLPGDPIRLQDLGSGQVVEVGGPALWTEIIGKPDTFPPSPTTSSNITDFGEATQDQIGANLIAGTNVAIVYDDTSGHTTISATAPPSGSVAYADITGKPSTFPPDAHTHNESEITSLVSDLAGKASVSHVHAESDVTGLVADLAAKASSAALTSGLAGKSNVGHTHTSSDITDFTEAAQDAVAGALVAGTGISVSYNDPANTITITNTAGGGGGGGTPNGYYGAFENGVTTTNSASTNVTNLNNLIATVSSAGGGTIWFNGAGNYQINSTINLKSFVDIIMSDGAVLQWTAGGSAPIFTHPITTVLLHTKLKINVDEGTSYSGVIFSFHSAQWNEWDLMAIGSNQTSVMCQFFADSTAGEPAGGGRNSAFNVTTLKHTGLVGSGLILQGIASGFGGGPQGATDNTFVNCQFNNIYSRGFKLNIWGDSNTFIGNTYAGISGPNSIGFVVNEGRDASSSVYNIWIDHIAIDIFGSVGGRAGVVFFESRGMTIGEMLVGPTLEAGDFIGTFCTSYSVQKMVNTGSSVTGGGNDHIYVHEKGLSRGT